MNPGNFFIPNYSYTMPMRNPGLFSRIFSGFRGINWGNFLTNANKTLNVVNQTIPLIRQTGPMFNNLRSIIQLTRAFNNETVTPPNTRNNSRTTSASSEQSSSISETMLKQADIPSESPNFFI